MVWWAALCCAHAGLGAQAASWLGAPAAFDVESEVLLNDVARSHGDVSYRIRSALSVAPLWAQPPDHYLLKFTVSSVQSSTDLSHILILCEESSLIYIFLNFSYTLLNCI